MRCAQAGTRSSWWLTSSAGVAGLVTLKRLVEGIVGRVRDEEQPGGQQEVLPLDENTVELDGGLSISEAKRAPRLGHPHWRFMRRWRGSCWKILGSIPGGGHGCPLSAIYASPSSRCGRRASSACESRAPSSRNDERPASRDEAGGDGGAPGVRAPRREPGHRQAGAGGLRRRGLDGDALGQRRR